MSAGISPLCLWCEVILLWPLCAARLKHIYQTCSLCLKYICMCVCWSDAGCQRAKQCCKADYGHKHQRHTYIHTHNRINITKTGSAINRICYPHFNTATWIKPANSTDSYRHRKFLSFYKIKQKSIWLTELKQNDPESWNTEFLPTNQMMLECLNTSLLFLCTYHVHTHEQDMVVEVSKDDKRERVWRRDKDKERGRERVFIAVTLSWGEWLVLLLLQPYTVDARLD